MKIKLRSSINLVLFVAVFLASPITVATQEDATLGLCDKEPKQCQQQILTETAN